MGVDINPGTMTMIRANAVHKSGGKTPQTHQGRREP